jgi:hypothetical protein
MRSPLFSKQYLKEKTRAIFRLILYLLFEKYTRKYSSLMMKVQEIRKTSNLLTVGIVTN